MNAGNIPERHLDRAGRNFIQHRRFTKQDGWRLYDLSVSVNEDVAVTGCNLNTNQTYVDVWTNVRHSESRDKPKNIYSKEFEKYPSEGRIHRGRFVSFFPGSETTILSGLGDKLEVIDLIQDRVIKSRKIKLEKHGGINCLSVRETELFIGFRRSNKITVYDVIDLNETKSILLQGIQDGYFPYDMTAIADGIFVCLGDAKEDNNYKTLIFEEKNGTILSELTKPTDTVKWYVFSLALNITLNVIAVVWSQTYEGTRKGIDVIVFYSLLSEKKCSFLIVEVEFGVNRIRISDRGDRMITGNRSNTGEVKVYDMAEFITYSRLKETLVSTLQIDDCVRLTNYFSLPKDQTDFILKRDRPGETFLLALEEKGVIHQSNVDKLCEAFRQLKTSLSCYHVTDFYVKTRTQATKYGRFLATLSAHLTASIPMDLCGYFHVPDEKKNIIISSQNPGLSVLLSLDEMGIIKPSEVKKLEQPFNEFRLVQARAKVDEYQIQVKQERAYQFKEMTNLTKEEKHTAFIGCLQRKIKSWYETMTPVPWKRSCRWKSTDLFVGSGLILTDSKSQSKLTDIDPHCKLEYQDVLTHERLSSESRLILEGESGCGKTMLSSQLAYDWAQNKFKSIKILIFLPLKFVENMTLVSAIRKFYVIDNTPVTEKEIQDTLDSGDLSTVILLDGLEEYNSPVTNVEGKPSEVHEIMSKRKYPGCKVVLTSRSDYANDLPECPMLKVGRFGETEKNTYIQKVFPDNLGKQQEIKRVIEDTPFILDLCSIPLLFVLAVHNVEGMHKLQKGQLDRVTPFMEGMVETLCPAVYFTDRSEVLSWVDYTPGGSPIEELAFNGLCKGFQQLSWQKDFMEENIDRIKEWIDSGVLMIEEGITAVVQDENITRIETQGEAMDVVKESIQQKKDSSTLLLELNTPGSQFQEKALDLSKEPIQERSVPSTSGTLVQKNKSVKMEGDDYETIAEGNIVTPAGQHQTNTEPSRHSEEAKGSKQTSSGTTAKFVPLRLKFLHKVFQEWFAAKYLSSVIWFKGTDYFSNQLTLVAPSDLHYVLRFTCYLCPPSCHIILNHLLKCYRDSEDTIPKHIMDCICLCYTEYDGYMGEDIKLVVSEICKQNLSIQSQDSRLLQQSKVALCRFASKSGIPIKKLQLLDVVRVAEKTGLTLNSDITLDRLDTLQVIEVSRWDQTLTEDHYSNLVAYIAASKSIHTANLSFPSQPPTLKPKTLEEVTSRNLTVHWQIGQLEQTLDPSKGMWMMSFKEHGSSKRGISPFNPNQGTDLNKLCGTKKRKGSDSINQPDAPEKKFQGVQGEATSSDAAQSQSSDCQNSLGTRAMVTKTGGVLEIPNTGVVLIVPPDALPEDMEHCEMHLRIVPSEMFKDEVSSFSSNSSAVVELLPDSLSLQCPARLSLPHCLVLEETEDRKARIFISHHRKGTTPQWEEQNHLSYHLEDTACIIYLNTFCWVKICINDEIVKAKKLVLYAAARNLRPLDKMAEIHAGYYLDLPDEEKVLQDTQDLVIAHRKIFYFIKSKYPLRISLDNIFPSGWRYESKRPRLQEISYEQIKSSTRYSVIYHLKRKPSTAGNPLCVFSVSQENGQISVKIAIHLKAVEKDPSALTITEPSNMSSLVERYEAPLRAVKETITNSGGSVQIPHSDVMLEIPQNALPADMDSCLIWMRIIQNRIVEDEVKSLCSNAATAVELFPSNLRLRRSAKLILPHCLQFKKSRTRCARIYTNNGSGMQSPWREKPSMSYELTDSACIVHLKKLCCVKYVIDDKRVTAKRIRVYTALKKIEESDELAEVEVGYYSDIPGGQELLRLNPNLVLDSQRTLPFMEKPNFALQFSLDSIFPEQWTCCIPKEKLQEIPFRVIASSIEHSHLYILQKGYDEPGNVTCRFTAMQKEGLMPVDISLRLSTSREEYQRPPQYSAQKTTGLQGQKVKLDTIEWLSKGLGANWRYVCRKLGLKSAELDELEANDKNNIQEVIFQSLRKWREKKGSNATVGVLSDALKKGDRTDLAEIILKNTDELPEDD